jgi:hypothetical protein
MLVVECPVPETVRFSHSPETLLTCQTAYENCGGSKSLVILAIDGVIIRTTGEASSAQIHGLHSYSILTSLVILFFTTLL